MSDRRPGAVAVVGLGRMGSRIARRLLGAGHEVIVWNRSPERASPLLDLGALAASTPAEAATRAAAVITMVSDPVALWTVTEGPDGVAAGAINSTTVIEMSTVGPAAVARLRALLPERARLLDAPVIGSVQAAESGSLTILVGGPRPHFEDALPILAQLGTPLHVGDLGAGAAAKLVANAVFFSSLAALGEAVALAQALGVPPEMTYKILAATPLASQAERRRDTIETREYPPRFPLALARKDAGLIAEAASAAGLRLKLGPASEAWLEEAEQLGLGADDYTAVLEAILQRHDGGASTDPPRYDGLMIDLDGVVWRGGPEHLIAGVAEAIAAIRANGTRVLFLTNDPSRSRTALAAALTEGRIPCSDTDVMTSAAATARVLGSLTGLARRTALVVGPPPLREELEGVGFRILEAGDAPKADVVVVAGHEGFDYRELCAATAAIRSGARLYATGRDAVFPAEEGLLPATGSILASIETAGGRPGVVVGKPEPIMFQMALESLAGCERVGVVGDHLVSDVAGAKRAGLDAILILTGITTRADLERAVIRPDFVIDSMAALVAEEASS